MVPQTLGVTETPATVALSDILSGLSQALDLTEGHPRGHTSRSCVIGMRLADIIGVPTSERTHLFYALLLKDAGCSSNAARVHQLFGGNDHEAKRGVWMRDWRSVTQQAAYGLQNAGRGGTVWDRARHLARLAASGQRGRRELFEIRCDRGAAVALSLGLSDSTAAAIRTMDEHWDGGGEPKGLRGTEIPLLGRIIGLAQVAEIFWHGGDAQAALDVAERRRNRWFDPDLVRALRVLTKDRDFWRALRAEDSRRLVAAAEPARFAIVADQARLDGVADAFATVIDAKSPFTSEHSQRVATFSVAIGWRLGFSAADLVRLRRAALLHDIGKLGVPNSILDKPSGLTNDEWATVRQHPAYTLQILESVPVFQELAFDAACHHERLDGSGYQCGYKGERLSQTARALAVADTTDALLADRPYRRGLDTHEAFRILRTCRDKGELCPASVEAVIDFVSAESVEPVKAIG